MLGNMEFAVLELASDINSEFYKEEITTQLDLLKAGDYTWSYVQSIVHSIREEYQMVWLRGYLNLLKPIDLSDK